jgi:hypothetical protein
MKRIPFILNVDITTASIRGSWLKKGRLTLFSNSERKGFSDDARKPDKFSEGLVKSSLSKSILMAFTQISEAVACSLVWYANIAYGRMPRFYGKTQTRAKVASQKSETNGLHFVTPLHDSVAESNCHSRIFLQQTTR